MKRFFYAAIIICCLSVLTQSCKKNNTASENKQVVNVSIKNSQDYTYSLGLFGDEEGATITRQAMHYQLSKVARESDLVNITYSYQPAANFVGTDEVEIRSARGSNGASANNKIVITTIKFTVTN